MKIPAGKLREKWSVENQWSCQCINR